MSIYLTECICNDLGSIKHAYLYCCLVKVVLFWLNMPHPQYTIRVKKYHNFVYSGEKKIGLILWYIINCVQVIEIVVLQNVKYIMQNTLGGGVVAGKKENVGTGKK